MIARIRHPQTTVRWRLTLLYGTLFLVSGALLLAVTYTLVSRATINAGPVGFVGSVRTAGLGVVSGGAGKVVPGLVRHAAPNGPNFQVAPQRPVGPAAIQKLLKTRTGRAAAEVVVRGQRIQDLHHLVVESAIALAIMALISGALGWLMAGRALAPLRTMTEATREISAASLDRRLAMTGPPDELHELGDTIDGLLARLEGAFEAQRRFVANASHELRTPLTASRALLEMVLSDPDASAETFRAICEQVLEEGDVQEQLIEALLALARGQRGIARPERFDLAAVVRGMAGRWEDEAVARSLTVTLSLHDGAVAGDPRLAQRLVSNLVDNALRHNVQGGRVEVSVEADGANDAATWLRVVNTGPVVPDAEVGRLLQPFQRLAPDRVGHGDGLGLGLSIVAAIAAAHGATLDVRARAEGGLDVEVRFPPASSVAPYALPERTSVGSTPSRRIAAS